MIGKTLKTVRVAVQLIAMSIVTWSLMAAPGAVALACRARVEHWMLIPMSMAGAMAVVGVWLMVTLLFGRVYCSTVCPIGTLLDAAGRLPQLAGKKRVYRYSDNYPRYARPAMLAILLMAVCLGSTAVSWTLMPFIQVSPYDSYGLMIASVEDVSVPTRFVISAGINLIFLIAAGAMKGRDVCNTLCPLGAALGTVNMLSLLHFDIDTDRCTRCRKCEYACKARCIDIDSGRVDDSRCVVCFDCVAVCDDDAISYTTNRHRLQTPLMQRVKMPKTAMSDPCIKNITNPIIDNETISRPTASHNG